MTERIRLRMQRLTNAFGSPRAFWLALAAALACAILVASQKLQPSDDAYITFRHVRNLLEHGRPAWNLSGDPVLGSTTPAFGLILALFCKIAWFVQIDHAALCLNVVFQFLIVALTYLVMRDLVGRVLPAILAALLVGVNSTGVYVFSQGFENAMFVAALLAALYLVRKGQDGFSVVLASIVPLIRPEGILLSPLVWGYILLRRRFKVRLLLAYLPIPLLWLAFSIPYYGSPVPHPIDAKKKFPLIYRPYDGEVLNLSRRLPNVLSHTAGLWKVCAGPLLLTGTTDREFQTTVQTCRGWLMLLGLPAALVCAIVRPDGRIIYLLYAPLFLLLYGWVGHTMPWYFPSFLTFSIILLYGGWIRAADLLRGPVARLIGDWALYLRAGQIGTVMLFAVFLTANSYTVNRGQYRYEHKGLLFPPHPWANQWDQWDLWEAQRHHGYTQAAEFLNAHTARPGVAMISEVGVFGYLYSGDVIDTVGLCSPEALAFYPVPAWDIRDPDGNFYTKANNFVPTNMVMALRPDFVVNSRYFMGNLFRRGSPFLEQYEEIARFRRIWGEPVVVYRRIQSPEHDGSDPSESERSDPAG